MKLLKYPVFKKGRVLKKEMLESIRDFPKKMFDNFYINYSDGIIKGFDFTVNENELIINPGIIKINNEILCLENKESINYENTNKEMIIKLIVDKKNLKKESDDFLIVDTEVKIEELSGELKENELELGRYKLREGAYLRTTYDKLEDFLVEYNTLNIINVKYSGLKEHTLKIDILHKFANELLLKAKEDFDILFAYMILNSETINREILIHYLEKKLKKDSKTLNNLEIYHNLIKIIKNLGRKVENNKNDRRVNKIIID